MAPHWPEICETNRDGTKAPLASYGIGNVVRMICAQYESVRGGFGLVGVRNTVGTFYCRYLKRHFICVTCILNPVW